MTGTFVFTATECSGELIDSPEGRLEWIPDEKVPSLNLWESDHIFLPWLKNGGFFSAKFDYEGDKMSGYEVMFHKRSTTVTCAFPGTARQGGSPVDKPF